MNPPSRCSVVGERCSQHCLPPQVNQIARVLFNIFIACEDKYETSVTTCYSGKQKGYICQQLNVYIIIFQVTH